ncbi:MAG TPA: glycosyltransferase, partial [Oceanipulchritudo sp.]|nr:glycosyltransferase [Oceanipulchritudo sp.]
NPMNASILQQFTPAPMLYAPLPYTDKAAMRAPIHRKARKSDTYNILFFGFLGSTNRRLQPFLEAFSESPVRDRFTITLAGIYPENEVTQWIQKFGIQKHVRLRGYLDDDALDGLLASSDLAMNLRWPSRGESSATLLRIWNHSLPSIVTDTNFYSTLPRDAVSFVSPQREKEEIKEHLQAFANNPEPYFKQGLNGRKHLETLNSVEAFVSSLKDFLPVVEQWRGKVYLQQFGRALARNYLAGYPDPDCLSGLANRCAHEIATWA